jgi:hypothetical protein
MQGSIKIHISEGLFWTPLSADVDNWLIFVSKAINLWVSKNG